MKRNKDKESDNKSGQDTIVGIIDVPEDVG
jgi:hypothetical protein